MLVTLIRWMLKGKRHREGGTSCKTDFNFSGLSWSWFPAFSQWRQFSWSPSSSSLKPWLASFSQICVTGDLNLFVVAIFFRHIFLPNLISWSILCERHFRVVNFGHDPGEQHCVHLHQPGGGDHLQDGQQPEPGAHDQSFVLVFCFGEECIIPARVGIVSLYWAGIFISQSDIS